MADNDDTSPREDGFELHGIFYRWTVADTGKDLMLIDHFAAMPVDKFFEVIEDSFDRRRGRILLTMIATSIRARHPDRSVERIIRDVESLSLGTDVEFIGGEDDSPIGVDVDDEGDARPPDEGSASSATASSSDEPASPQPSTTSERSSET